MCLSRHTAPEIWGYLYERIVDISLFCFECEFLGAFFSRFLPMTSRKGWCVTYLILLSHWHGGVRQLLKCHAVNSFLSFYKTTTEQPLPKPKQRAQQSPLLNEQHSLWTRFCTRKKNTVTVLAYPLHHTFAILSASYKFTCLTLKEIIIVFVCWYAFITRTV